MLITAKLSNLHIAPRKVRLVTNLIKGRDVKEAKTMLNFTVKRPVTAVLKLLNSAIANAKNNYGLDEGNLYVSKIFVDEGRKQKKFRPRARGKASEIQKKTSHVTIVLDEMKAIAGTGKIREKKEKEQIIKTRETAKRELEKPKFGKESKAQKPRLERAVKRIFRRKAF